MAIVGTKKSIETIWPTCLCRKVRHLWLGGRRSLRSMRDTVRSEMAIPSISSSPGILGARHNGLAAVCSIHRRSSAAVPGRPGRRRGGWLGQPGPESAEAFALPTNDGVGLNIHQRMSPAGPYAAQSGPKYSVPGCEQRALPFALKRRALQSQRCVLNGNRRMSAEEQADESKNEQQKHWHVFDSFHPSRCQSTRYARTEYWRTTA